MVFYNTKNPLIQSVVMNNTFNNKKDSYSQKNNPLYNQYALNIYKILNIMQ